MSTVVTRLETATSFELLWRAQDEAAAANASSCLGLVFEEDSTSLCSLLPELVVSATGLHTVSYRRTGPPVPAPPAPPAVAETGKFCRAPLSL